MKITRICSFAMDEIKSRRLFTIFIIFIMIIGTVLIGVSIFLKESTDYYEKVCDKTLTKGNAGTYFFDSPLFSTGYNDDLSGVGDKIRQIEAIDNIGVFGYEVDPFWVDADSILELQKNASYDFEQYYGEENSVKLLYVTYDALGMLNIKPEEGEFEYLDEPDTCYIYLGSKMKSIPVGSEFTRKITYKDENKNEITEIIKYVVKGYIEEDSYLINDSVSYRDPLNTADYFYSLDYLILCVGPPELEYTKMIYQTYFTVKDGYDAQDVKKQIADVFSEKDMIITFSDFDDAFKSMRNDYKTIYEYVLQIAIIMFICVAFLQVSVKSINIIKNSKKYGIMYANGFTKNDLRAILIVQSIIEYFIVMFIVLGNLAICYYILNNFGEDLDLELKKMDGIMYCIKHFVIAKTMLITMGVMAIGTAVPIYIINRMSPVKLIKNGG